MQSASKKLHQRHQGQRNLHRVALPGDTDDDDDDDDDESLMIMIMMMMMTIILRSLPLIYVWTSRLWRRDPWEIALRSQFCHDFDEFVLIHNFIIFLNFLLAKLLLRSKYHHNYGHDADYD